MAVVPLDHSRGGSILRGQQTWDLDQFSLYNRVINIRFDRRSGRSFCLRSDYEVVFAKNGDPHFIPMRQKPDIKLTYKQAGQQVAIKVDVRITNLHIVNEAVGKEILSNSGDPITSMQIYMGYIKQFPDWTMPPLAFDPDEGSLSAESRLDMFYNMQEFNIIDGYADMDTLLHISVQTLAIYPEGNPPDRVIYIQGIIGTLDYGLQWQKGDSPMTAERWLDAKNNFPPLPDDRKDVPWTPLEQVLWMYITSRFFRRGGFRYQIYDSKYDPAYDQAQQRVSWVKVLDYDEAAHKWKDDAASLARPLADRWSRELSNPNGIFHPEDAAQLGVVCYISPMLLAKSASQATPSTTPSGTANIKPYNIIPSIQFMANQGAQMLAIQAAWPYLRWYEDKNGNYYFYDVRDKVTDIITDSTAFTRAQRALRDVLLPAVYDISIGALRTIRCPFVGFISTMQRIGFSAKYNIGSFVGFFYPHPKDAWYLSILIDIAFSTVGNENMMTITCVDAPASTATTLANETEGEDETTTEEAARAVERAIEWHPIKVGLGYWSEIPGQKGLAEGPTTWSHILNNYVFNNDTIRGIDGVPERGAPYKEALDFFLSNETNKSNNDAWLKDRPLMDAAFTDFYGLTGLIGSLRPGDEIYIPIAIPKDTA